nr:MAG TPA: Positive regulator of sigma(E), RseC/MucC [Caudoviricetes sp.]
MLTGVVSKQVRKGDDAEKAKQFAKEQARPQKKYQIQIANGSIDAKVGDKIKVEVVNTNSFYDYQ